MYFLLSLRFIQYFLIYFSLFFSGDEESLIATAESHTGPVQALDFNPFQPQLLASGGPGGEVRKIPLIEKYRGLIGYLHLLSRNNANVTT